MKKQQTSDVKKGELLLLSCGEYSDYGIETLLKASKDFDVIKARDAYLCQFPTEKEHYGFCNQRFMAWLCNEGYSEEVSYREFYLGSYDSSDMEMR